LLPEVVALFPEVKSLSAGKVLHSYMSDSMMLDSSVYLVSISTDIRMRQNEEQRLNLWLQQRLGRKDIKMVVLPIRR
jgi:hypothetical protein